MDISALTGFASSPAAAIRPPAASQAVNAAVAARHTGQGPGQRAYYSSVNLSVHEQPLRLILKIVLEKIAASFAFPDRRPCQVSHLELTIDSTVFHLFNAVHRAFELHRQRNAAGRAGDFILQIYEAITEGLLEARIVLSRLDLYDETMAATVGQIARQVDERMQRLFKR